MTKTQFFFRTSTGARRSAHPLRPSPKTVPRRTTIIIIIIIICTDTNIILLLCQLLPLLWLALTWIMKCKTWRGPKEPERRRCGRSPGNANRPLNFYPASHYTYTLNGYRAPFDYSGRVDPGSAFQRKCPANFESFQWCRRRCENW